MSWKELDDGTEVLNEPDELVLTLYLAIEQSLHMPKKLLDVQVLNPELAELLTSAHPRILKDPATGEQRRPLNELGLIRAEVEYRETTIPVSQSATARLAAEEFGSDIRHAPNLGRLHEKESLEASVFVVSIHLNTLVMLRPELRNSFVYYNYLRTAELVSERVLEASLEEAIQIVSRWSQASYKLARNTVHLFGSKILDPQIPYVLQPGDSDNILRAGFVKNRSRTAAIQSERLARTLNTLDDFDVADRDGPLDEFLMTMQEATSAFNRGLNRSAVVMTATAAESLFNTLLQLLHWEKCMLPDDIAEQWDELAGIQARVKSEFSSFLGGNWDLSQPGPLHDWAQRVANLRNDVVHGGLIPSDPEVQAAFETTYGLVTELVDRLTNQRNLNRFTRTAVLLAGNQGLEKRNRWTRRVRNLQEMVSEPDWHACSQNWIAQHLNCLRAKQTGWKEKPLNCEIILVIRSADGFIAALEHAPDEGWARSVLNPETLVAELPTSIARVILDAKSPDSAAYITLQIERTRSVQGILFGERLPAYRLVPNLRIMVGPPRNPELEFKKVPTITDHWRDCQSRAQL
ncbi:hypothetical protein [Brevibacterium linens]|uniref:hypothetical protein n=1 Tax=Brevibacterium linens TaxID=1703 RepID=UPI0011AF61D3|nr:hypothetical protein [Brevibacterium linens]KAB1948264.1 hypothetical protein F8227_06485 [Brevibacterium linens ATCC 9172]